MGNTLRCCLACVLPFGALDLIRIVHLNGQIEEITHPVTAGEVLGNYPNHVLTKPAAAADQGVVRRILILSPSSDLKRGTIYFLIPASSLPQQHQKKKHAAAGLKSRNKKELSSRHNDDGGSNSGSESWPEKKKPSPSQRHRRSGRVVGEWRPHLASISEN
ncbi:unnamed protein product [Cuscuta campestris]|uniref:DUF4228 domain-containing protein n=2 Tax=Cuscuta sect. Cleistogrammica TaxID=1824901 RepID=A0A484NHK6_9ASTE|nr:hypothetical protein DM860_012101 [Cuscuta australis]VFR00444.1 unnamed protein product [Cuscuta campestris]